jgi:hypothetical protein
MASSGTCEGEEMHIEDPTTAYPDDIAGPAAVRAFFEALPDEVLANRGRIVFEPETPFLILQCDGCAARILGTTSSRVTGRMMRTIVADSQDRGKIEQASRASLSPHKRCYLSIKCRTATGGNAPLVIHLVESTTGRLQLEALLFPTECPPSLLTRLVIDDLSCLPKRQRSPSPHRGRSSPTKDLQVEPVEFADDLLAGLTHILFPSTAHQELKSKMPAEGVVSPTYITSFQRHRRENQQKPCSSYSRGL